MCLRLKTNNTVTVDETPTLYSRVCFNMSSSSRVKFSSTDTARISWNAWQSETKDSDWVWGRALGQSLSQYKSGRPTVLHTKAFLKVLFSLLTSASLDDMNLSTTCLRYSKLISRLSLRSEVLVTVGLEVGGLGLDAGGRSGQNLSCFSARISGNFSFPSASGSGFSFYRA